MRLRSTTMFLSLLVFANLFTPANSAECLAALVSAKAPDFDKSVIEERTITVQLTNLSNTPIGHVTVEFSIWSDLRPMALYQSEIRSALTIPGGLLPGETSTFTDYHFMEDREKALAQEAAALSLTLNVEAVRGVDGMPLVCQ